MKPKKIGTVTTVDIETGDVIDVKRNAFTMLPPEGDKCQECAVDHAWDQPHNQQSLYYQYHFHSRHGRWPTWTDAMAHCPETVRAAWRPLIRERMAANGMTIPPDLLADDDGAVGTR